MCGIVGFLAPSAATENVGSSRETVMHRALSCMVHRGPDAEGRWRDAGSWGEVALGHRRLSIIDLSSAGSQPMISDFGVIVFNGEIYNFHELTTHLQSQGVVFRSNSDTEVLMHGLRIEGPAFVKRLRGMYAFAYWNRASKELWVGRDPFGKKPFYFYEAPTGECWFSSELSSLVSSGAVKRPRVRKDLLPFYFESGAFPQPESAIDGVHALEAGAVEKWLGTSSGLRRVQVLKMDPMVPDLTSTPLSVRDAAIQAVQRRFISDRPVGVLLSGGFDSALITGIAKKLLGLDVHTFSLGFGSEISDYDESQEALKWSDRFGSTHHSLLLSKAPGREELDRFCVEIDQPSADGLNSYLISREAKREVTVLLSGVGADELFGGYHLFSFLQKLKPLFSHPLRHRGGARDLLLRQTPRAYWGALLDWVLTGRPKPEELYVALRGIERLDPKVSPLLQYCRGLTASTDSYITALRKIYCREYLANTLLRDADAVTMAHSIELRCPFLDWDLAQSSHQVAPFAHIDGSFNKPALRAAFEDLIPPSHGNQKKKGFVLPIGKWCRDTGIYDDMRTAKWRGQSWVVEYLGAERFREWLDAADKTPDALQRNYRVWTRLWMTYVLDTWSKELGVLAPE